MADDFYKLYCEEVEKNEKLVKENKYLKGRVRSLSSQLDYLMENQDKIIERKVNKQVDKITDAFENKITTMQKKIDNLNSILNNDSTNSGLPTSKTPLNKKKHIPAELCSTGEQKSLLISIILAQSKCQTLHQGFAPVLLLDEVTAHLDDKKRDALLEKILVLKSQAWITATTPAPFTKLQDDALFLTVRNNQISPSK